MASEERDFIVAHFRAQDERLNRNLEALESRLGGKLDAIEDRLRAEIRHAARELETKILTAFQKWASPNEIRQRATVGDVRALEAELNYLRERVEKLERPS